MNYHEDTLHPATVNLKPCVKIDTSLNTALITTSMLSRCNVKQQNASLNSALSNLEKCFP